MAKLSKVSIGDFNTMMSASEVRVDDQIEIEAIIGMVANNKMSTDEALTLLHQHIDNLAPVMMDTEPMNIVDWERDNMTLFASQALTGAVTRDGFADMRENAVLCWQQAQHMVIVGREIMTTAEDGEVSFLIEPPEEDADSEPTLG